MISREDISSEQKGMLHHCMRIVIACSLHSFLVESQEFYFSSHTTKYSWFVDGFFPFQITMSQQNISPTCSSETRSVYPARHDLKENNCFVAKCQEELLSCKGYFVQARFPIFKIKKKSFLFSVFVFVGVK